MFRSRLRPIAAALAASLVTFPPLIVHAADIETVVSAATPPAKNDTNNIAASGPQKIAPIEITSQKLDDARNGLSPDTGSTVFRFDKKDILSLPLGDATPLNQVILRAPGVVEDSYGQIHVRGDHANLQYRINGVVIPESISGFGQALDTRFANQINILTGALPAQYGYRTAGVVDIQSKGSGFDNGGSVTLLGGSQRHRELGAEAAGTSGGLSYYLTGSTLQNNLGIENPTAARNAIHDNSKQQKSFGYLSYLLNDSSRVSFIFGTANNRFQIPNVPNQTPEFDVSGAAPIASANLDANQRERNDFQVLSFQSNAGLNVDYQVSLFRRDTDVRYRPDALGDLAFNGVAANILRRNEAIGLQGDLTYRLGDRHTLRSGIFLQRERAGTDNTSAVFPADSKGIQTSTTPFSITDNSRINGRLGGVYLQDEWTPVKGLTINAGARYDRVDTVVKESQLSPRIGLVFDLSEKTRLHAGYARYFTPPPTEKIDTTSVAKFLGTTNALPSDANTAVKSERSDYLDIGFTHQLTPQLSLGVDAYYRAVKHIQDEGQFGKALIFSAFNYAQGRVRGVEFSSTFKQKNLSAFLNVSWSKAEAKRIETGQFNFDAVELAYINSHWVHLDHDQAIAASAGTAYQFGSASISADLIYGSGLRRGFANTENLPGYTQFNLAFANKFEFGAMGKIETRLSIINLFDRSYQLRDGSGIGVGAPQFAPRRTFYLAMTKRF